MNVQVIAINSSASAKNVAVYKKESTLQDAYILCSCIAENYILRYYKCLAIKVSEFGSSNYIGYISHYWQQ